MWLAASYVTSCFIFPTPGLVSDGGVHSHIDHTKGLLAALKTLNAPPAYLHFFSDGRDTRPTSGTRYMDQMLQYISELGYGSLATVMGRCVPRRCHKIIKCYDNEILLVNDNLLSNLIDFIVFIPVIPRLISVKKNCTKCKEDFHNVLMYHPCSIKLFIYVICCKSPNQSEPSSIYFNSTIWAIDVHGLILIMWKLS